MKKVIYPGLKAEMAIHGDTLNTIAKMLKLTTTSISSRMNGKVDWSISEIEKICEHYGKDYYELFSKKKEN